MNQFFNSKRFALLVAKHWADNKKRYGLSILAFIGLLIAWFVFVLLLEDDKPMGREIQQITYFLTLFAVGSFYASQYFRDLGSRARGINFLLVPASSFEKTLCSLLYTVVLFFVVFTATFYAVDLLMVTISNAILGTNEQLINVFTVILMTINDDSIVYLLFFFFSVQAAFLLGSIYFEKYSFIKTVIAGFITWFVLFCLMYLFYSQLLPPGNYHGFFTAYRVQVDDKIDHLVQVPYWVRKAFTLVLMYGVAPFLWIVTYYRLKEKQV